jgi:hypothetical protein
MQGFEAIARLIQDALEKALSAGIPHNIASQILIGTETALVNALCAERSKFISSCRETGTAGMAERLGITPRAVRKRRQKALAKVGTKTPTLVPL